MKKSLQGQHFNMAAIIANGWGYEENEKKSRHKSVCQLNTDNLFTYSEKERESGKLFFEYMKDKQLRDSKIDSCISEDPKLQTGRNTIIENIFKSYLIRQETEEELDVKSTEENFLNLLKISNNFQINKLDKENTNLAKKYIALQYIRNPLFYRFLIDGYFKYKLEEIHIKNSTNMFLDNYPILFKELSLLDKNRLTDFIDFCNNQIKILYKYYIEMFNQYNIMSYYCSEVHNYLGHLSCFNLNFKRLGINDTELKKIGYFDNQDILNNCIYTPTSSNSFLIAIKKTIYNDATHAEQIFRSTILPIIINGHHNQLIFTYSKYIICHPNDKKLMSTTIKKIFDLHDIKEFYNVREEEISYLDTLEKLLLEMKKKEKLLR